MLLASIKRVFTHSPYVANSCTGFFAYAIGDSISQVAVKNMENGKMKPRSGPLDLEIDVTRALVTGVFGSCINGLFFTKYYFAIDKYFGSANNTANILKKMLVDQFVSAPICIALFFGFSSSRRKMENMNLKTLSFDEGKEKIIDVGRDLKELFTTKFLHVCFADCLFWTPSNYVTYKFIPVNYRPSFVALMATVWQTYMSSVSNPTPQEEEELKIKEAVTVTEFIVADCQSATDVESWGK